MNILIACEESQRVCIAFRDKGHNAFSCDILSCSGGHPEWHICGDVLPLLNGNCDFYTLDGVRHRINRKWDVIIAHPPCTYLTLSGNKWFKPDQYIEPYMFGDPEKKKTGLWLKGLPLLKPTNIVEPVIIHCKSGANEPRWHVETMHLPKAERSRARSRTFIGIAKAMAEQWG